MVAVLQPVKQGKVIAIDRAVVMVGRGSDCDAIITDSQKISRRHCCLVQVDSSYYIRDLGSMNGVRVNGERVERESQMKLGDRVQIGDVEFQFHPNARVEQRKTITTPPPEGELAEALPVAAVGDPGEIADVVAASGDDVQADLLNSGQIKFVPAADEIAAESEPEFEVIDDVIPLDVDDAYLQETNEVEIIDQPIVDDEVRQPPSNDDDDEIVIFED